MAQKPNKKLKKKPDITTKTGKYFMAVRKGKTKKEAQIVAGYRTDTHATQIERSKEFKALQEHFGTNLQQHITVSEINGYLADNIRQEGETKIDRNARNKAIEIAKEMIEPANKLPRDEGDKVLIVLK